jgi:hypothetical protein
LPRRSNDGSGGTSFFLKSPPFQKRRRASLAAAVQIFHFQDTGGAEPVLNRSRAAVKKTPKGVDERPAGVINHCQGAGQCPKNNIKKQQKKSEQNG